MADSPLAARLQIKPDRRILAIHPPPGLIDSLKPLPSGTQLSTTGRGRFDVVIACVVSRKDVDARALGAMVALAQDGILWMVYPKKSSGVATDVTRDHGWDALYQRGYQPVSQVAVDDTWSALRFKKDPALAQARAERGSKVGVPQARPDKVVATPPAARPNAAASKTDPSERKTEPPPKPAPPAASATKRGAAPKPGAATKRGAAPKRGAATKPGAATKRGAATKPGAAPKRGAATKPGAARERVAAPAELHALLRTNAIARAAWESLAPSHRREYVKWIDEAKKLETRASRLEKTIAMLVAGKG
ncbi:MAG: YdeI/OmpD-associated family protein [Deltaproteobacteria bacterium]|nr:YdeI/OmpD-associated family protein [Deltaproteobacteria bacterium]